MRFSLFLLCIILFTVIIIPKTFAEEPAPLTDDPSQDIKIPEEESSVGPNTSESSPLQKISPRRGKMVVLEISARIIEENQTVVWDESHRKITLPGRPVGIKLVGDNIVVAVQFTPYMRRNMGCYLVAQGQIWMDIPDHGIRYHTTMQTIPVEFGEQIYFFPLGSHKHEDASGIEVMLTMQPYDDDEEE